MNRLPVLEAEDMYRDLGGLEADELGDKCDACAVRCPGQVSRRLCAP